MTNSSVDVAIVGGGVAGCSAAIRLARQGYKVVLLEAREYPHHKVCGEFMSPECTSLLAELGLLDAIRAVAPAKVHTVTVIAPDGTGWETKLPGTGIGISRYALDSLMAEQARSCGVDIREGTTVTSIQGSLATGFKLTSRTKLGQESIRAKVVIGAYGKRSNLDRQLKRTFFKSNHPFMGLKNHFYGSLPAGHIHLHTFPGGYCGMSEIENGRINVCLLVEHGIFQSAASSNIAGFIEWMKVQNPRLGQQLARFQPVEQDWLSIAQIPFSNKEVIADDIFMTGDSAGLISPVAGDGMGMALQASKILSSLLNDYLTGRLAAEGLRQDYTHIWWHTFGRRLRLSRLVQEFMLRPRWLTPGLHLLNGIPALGRLLVTHTRDSQLVRF